MSFLNPWLLFGVAAIASPIVIHLLARKQTKRVVWAAMRFLKATVDRNQRRMTLEDILLLLLRCLVLVLLALALARPALRSSGLAVLGAAETAIILLDDSGSMSTSDGVATRFEKAQKAAEQIIDALPSGSAVAVWLVSDRVKQPIPEPTRDLALARKAIREAKRTDEGTAWPQAVRRALEMLERLAGSGKQMYLVTDGQGTGWSQMAEARKLLQEAHPNVQARVVLTGEGEQSNLAITHVRMAGAMPTLGQPVRLEVGVSNFGVEDQRDVSVSLGIDEEAPSEAQLVGSIPPTGEPAMVSLFANFSKAGYHSVTARLRSDRCGFDDARTFAVRVLDEIDVLLVDGDPRVEPRDAETFYLRNALVPVSAEQREKYFIKTKTITGAEFEQTILSEYECVVLANVVDLPAPAVESLETYVRAGGGLMVFPGDRINVPFYNERMHARGGLLPAAFGVTRGEAPEKVISDTAQQFFHLQSKDYTHRIGSPWNDPNSGSLATAQFYRAFSLVPGKADGDAGPPAIALSFADHAPAIVERTYGSGRVLQFASSADTAWNDLPIRPVFLPLVHRSLGYLLSRDEERLNVRAGTPYFHAFSPKLADREVIVVAPGQKKEDVRPQPVEIRNQVPTLRHEDTSSSGVYQVILPETPGADLRFAVSSDPSESNLREVSTSDLGALHEIAPVVRWKDGINLQLTIQRQRTGTELWIPLLVAVLLLAAAETVLGNRWSRSR